MAVDGLFGVCEPRGSLALTPVARKVASEEARGGLFDDPVSFERELSASSLGLSELAKFERNVYKSRYLDTEECRSLLSSLLASISRNAPRVSSLVAARPQPTLSVLAQFLSPDHLRSLAGLAVLGNFHSLDNVVLKQYLLDLLRLVFRCVAGSLAHEVERARAIHSFLTRPESNQRVVLLYSLTLCVLERVLASCGGEVGYDEVYSALALVVCCFVESLVGSSGVECVPQRLGLLPALSGNAGLLQRHFSVLSHVLALGAVLPVNGSLLESVRALSVRVRSGRNRPLVVWCSLLSIYLDSDGVASSLFKAPRQLFDEVGVNADLVQFRQVVSCLRRCFSDTRFRRYVEDNLSVSKFVSIFLFNTWRHIDRFRDDLANEILVLANSLLSSFPRVCSSLSSLISRHGPSPEGRLGQGLQKSMEALFNIALFGKSRLQMSSTLFLSKLLQHSDVTNTLPKVNKVKYYSTLVDFITQSSCVEYNMECNDSNEVMIQYLSKVLLLTSLIKFCWKDLVSFLFNKVGNKIFHSHNNIKVDGMVDEMDDDVLNLLNYIKSLYVTNDALYNVLLTSNLPMKMLAYETIKGLKPKPDVLIMCGLVILFNHFPKFSTLYTQSYQCSKYDGMECGRCLMYTNDEVYMNEMVRMVMMIYVDGCDLTRQKLVNGLLKQVSEVSVVEKEKCEVLGRKVDEMKVENQRLRVENEQLKTELSDVREEHERNVAKLNEEMGRNAQRYKNEMGRMKDLLNKTNCNLSQVEETLSNTKSEMNLVRQENSKIASERDGLRNELNSLKCRLSEQKKEIDKFYMQLKDFESMSSQFKKLQTEHNRIKEEYSQTNSNLESLYKMLIYLTDKYKTNLSALENYSDQNKSLNQQLVQYKSNLERLDHDIKEKQRVVNDLMNSKRENEMEMSRLKDEIMRREDALNNSNNKINELKDKINQISISIQEMNEKYNSLKREHQSTLNELNARKLQLNAIESAVNKKPIY